MIDRNVISIITTNSEESISAERPENIIVQSDLSYGSQQFKGINMNDLNIFQNIKEPNESRYVSISIKLDVDIEEEMLDKDIINCLGYHKCNPQVVMINYHVNLKGIHRTKHVHLAVGYDRSGSSSGGSIIKKKLENMLCKIFDQSLIKEDSVKCLFRPEDGLIALIDYMYKRSLPNYPKNLLDSVKGTSSKAFKAVIKSLIVNGGKYYNGNLPVSVGVKTGSSLAGDVINSWMKKEDIKKDIDGNDFRKYTTEDNKDNVKLWKILTRIDFVKFFSCIDDVVGRGISRVDVQMYADIIYNRKETGGCIESYKKNYGCVLTKDGLLDVMSNKIREYKHGDEPFRIFDFNVPTDVERGMMFMKYRSLYKGEPDEKVKANELLLSLGSLMKPSNKNHPIVCTGKGNNGGYDMVPDMLCGLYEIEPMLLTKKGVDVHKNYQAPVAVIRDSEDKFSTDMIRKRIWDKNSNEDGESSGIGGSRMELPVLVFKNSEYDNPPNIKEDQTYIAYVCLFLDLLNDYDQYLIFNTKYKKGLKPKYSNLILPKPCKLRSLISSLRRIETRRGQHDEIFNICFPIQCRRYIDYRETNGIVKTFNYTSKVGDEYKSIVASDRNRASLIFLSLVIEKSKNNWDWDHKKSIEVKNKAESFYNTDADKLKIMEKEADDRCKKEREKRNSNKNYDKEWTRMVWYLKTYHEETTPKSIVKEKFLGKVESSDENEVYELYKKAFNERVNILYPKCNNDFKPNMTDDVRNKALKAKGITLVSEYYFPENEKIEKYMKSIQDWDMDESEKGLDRKLRKQMEIIIGEDIKGLRSKNTLVKILTKLKGDNFVRDYIDKFYKDNINVDIYNLSIGSDRAKEEVIRLHTDLYYDNKIKDLEYSGGIVPE